MTQQLFEVSTNCSIIFMYDLGIFLSSPAFDRLPPEMERKTRSAVPNLQIHNMNVLSVVNMFCLILRGQDRGRTLTRNNGHYAARHRNQSCQLENA